MSQTTVNRYCYSRNGTLLLDSAFQPCNNATNYSACCMTNHSGAGHVNIANDVCMDNGLCQNFEAYDKTNKGEGQQVWGIQGCTAQLWNTPYCLANVCDTKKYPGDQYGNVGVWNCGGQKWCCGEKSCCDDENNIFELAATVGQLSIVPSATSFTSTLILPASSPAASPSSKGDAPSGGLSTGAKAGIGIGVAVFVILAAAVIFLLFRPINPKGQKRDPADRSMQRTEIRQEQKHHGHIYANELYPEHGLSELSEVERAELATYNAPQELEARNEGVH